MTYKSLDRDFFCWFFAVFLFLFNIVFCNFVCSSYILLVLFHILNVLCLLVWAEVVLDRQWSTQFVIM